MSPIGATGKSQRRNKRDPLILIETDSATSIGSTGATLNGELAGMDGESSVDVWFKYGQVAEDILFTTNKQSLSSPGTFNATISGLHTDTAHDFWAIADFNGTKLAGDILRFSTTT